MAAGVQWRDAYAFAEAHNITLPGVREHVLHPHDASC
jgi:hypothetical protein